MKLFALGAVVASSNSLFGEPDRVCKQRDGTVTEEACGYACDADCNCGRCNTAPACMNEDGCLGTCNAGNNAKWCGKAPPPPPPTPPVPPPSPPPAWSTGSNSLQKNGQDVRLIGMGTTCTEYLLRGVGMHCWIKYNWADSTDIFKVDVTQVYPVVDTLLAIAKDDVVPAIRIPMTASSWLGVNTSASAENIGKYPNLGQQYQNFIADLVDVYTSRDIVAILDLHWTDDDTDNAAMAGKGESNCVDFWDSVASRFADNGNVFFELYNEPHRVTQDQWMNGDSQYSGMLEMLAAVRKHSTNPVIIAGYGGYAYDADSLVEIDGHLNGDRNVIYNFHPYMGPNQHGDSKKCAQNFETYAQTVLDGTDKPVIITEFGQRCNPTHGAAEDCSAEYDGKTMGYDETILTIADKHGISWLPWAWRPMSTGPNANTCQDVNGGELGTEINHVTDGKGADWLTLWETFAKPQQPAPTPPSPVPVPVPVPTPSLPHCHATDGSFDGPACGYNCDENCNCGRCNSKAGCLSEDSCLGACNGGGNAKWCPGNAISFV